MLRKKGALPRTYEEYIAGKEALTKQAKLLNETNFNAVTPEQIMHNWEGTPQPTFALKGENIKNNSLFRGDYAVQIRNAAKHGISGADFGHLGEHWTLKYPMSIDHPDVAFYKKHNIPFIGKGFYTRVDPRLESSFASNIPQMSFMDYWRTNAMNKLLHPFNAEAIRLLTNSAARKSYGLLTDEELSKMVEGIKKMKIATDKQYGHNDKLIYIPKGTLDGWSISHELGHIADGFDTRNLSNRTFLYMPINYHYNALNDPDIEAREFFADLFANNNYPQMPFDINTALGLRERLEAIKRSNIDLKKALIKK